MNKKQIKFILFLVGALIILVISIILAISHINYAVTYKEWYSYITKTNAIIVSIISILMALNSGFLMIYSIIKIIKINKLKGVS